MANPQQHMLTNIAQTIARDDASSSTGGTPVMHLIWDWNGTLLDDVQPCVNAINRMLNARSLPCINRDQYRNIFDFPVKTYYRRLGFDLEHEDWDAMANEFHQHYGELAITARLREGTAETLEFIRRHGVTMSVLSACEHHILERMLQERGIRQYFQHVYGLDNLYAASKLDQGRRLLKVLTMPTDHIFLIGDTNHDHDVAQALGIHCIMLEGGHQAEHRLACPHRIPTPQDLITVCLEQAVAHKGEGRKRMWTVDCGERNEKRET